MCLLTCCDIKSILNMDSAVNTCFDAIVFWWLLHQAAGHADTYCLLDSLYHWQLCVGWELHSASPYTVFIVSLPCDCP